MGVVWVAAMLAAAAVWLWPARASRAAGSEVTTADDADGGPERVGPREVAEAVDLLALALTSGASVASCLALVADHAPGAIARELRQVSVALDWGVEPRAAWSAVSPMWREAGAALALADAAGVAPGDLLGDASARIRSQEHHRVETAGAAVAVRLVIPLGLCFLPAFALLTVVPAVVALASSLLGSP